MTKIYLNGQLTDTTPALDTVLAELGTRVTTAKEAREAEEAQKATNKVNAKAKLIAGEALTEAEADTIVL